jgi:hypothetical protein
VAPVAEYGSRTLAAVSLLVDGRLAVRGCEGVVELNPVEQRYHAALEVPNNGTTVSDVARRNGVARQTVHEWLRRDASKGLVDGSARPLSCPHQMSAEVEVQS